MFGFMEFQLFGIFDELNALASLPNEPRNVPCATGHLPGPLGPAGPVPPSRDRHFSIGAFSDFRIYGDTLKSLQSSKVQ